MSISKNILIDKEFLIECKSILSKIDSSPKIFIQTPLFFEEELFPFQVQYKNILFEAKCVEDLFSLLNVYVFFVNKKYEVFKENSVYHIEIEKNLKISSENIVKLKRTFSTYQNIKKKFPKILIKNKLINHKMHFFANVYNSNFVSEEFELLASEIKLYDKNRSYIEKLISAVDSDFSILLEKNSSNTSTDMLYKLEYKDYIITEKSYNSIIKKLKKLLKMIAEIQKIVSLNFKLSQTPKDKIFKIKYMNREIIGKRKHILEELNLLKKYNIIQLSIEFKN